MDLYKWNKNITFNFNYTEARINIDRVTKISFQIKERSTIVKIIKFNNTIIEFEDVSLDPNNLGSFKRNFKGKSYIYLNNKLVMTELTRQVKFIEPTHSNKSISDKILAMDLETRARHNDAEGNNKDMDVVCISFYDGKKANSFYITDFKDQADLINSALKSIFIRKYTGYKVYLHNFSNFDGIFIISALSDFSTNIRPVIRDGKIMDLRVKFGPNNRYSISFRDSLLLLPNSLRKLCKDFGIEVQKDIFPYEFINQPGISMNYRGPIPEFKFFSNITQEEYKDYCSRFNNNWDLREEIIKYCELDVITLWKVLNKFQNIIYKRFGIDIQNTPTISSLAFSVYRTKYMPIDADIAIITGKLYKDLKTSYTGGAVDVYRAIGKNILRYDVNSLFPSQMKSRYMPVGTPRYFTGDILKHSDNKDPFGFFYCKVFAPNLNEPILQVRSQILDRTVAPIGAWSGLYFSEEIKNAMKYGYKFEVTKGYLFDKKIIFNDYVDCLYDLKCNSIKGTSEYSISKLLLNSLYGRFGMSPDRPKHVIVTNEVEQELMLSDSNNTYWNPITLLNGKRLLTIINNNSDEDDDKETINISVAIASAITAYSRIDMSQYKNNPNFNLYYSDTDSIDIDKPLEPKSVGTGIGLMKLENVFKKVVYLSPKVYGGITQDDKEYVKVKGYKNSLPYKKLEPLLTKDNKLVLTNIKWYKDLTNATITIKPDHYTLAVTSRKRDLVYNDNNVFIKTKPIYLVEDEFLSPSLQFTLVTDLTSLNQLIIWKASISTLIKYVALKTDVIYLKPSLALVRFNYVVTTEHIPFRLPNLLNIEVESDLPSILYINHLMI